MKQTAYISVEKYMNKEYFSFGSGVIACFDENTAFEEINLIKSLDVNKECLEIEIPEIETFLDFDKLLLEHPFNIIDSLCSDKALSLLFYDDVIEFNKKLDIVVKQNSEENQLDAAKDEIKRFYEEKAGIIKNILTVDSLIQFITDRARSVPIDTASSFLYEQGINGIVYDQNNNKHILIFNARKSIKTKQLKTTLIQETEYSA